MNAPIERLADKDAHDALYDLINDEVAEAFTGARDDELRERIAQREEEAA